MKRRIASILLACMMVLNSIPAYAEAELTDETEVHTEISDSGSEENTDVNTETEPAADEEITNEETVNEEFADSDENEEMEGTEAEAD